ncbi:MAG: hypothetical protein RBR68_14535 [Tenuifilaceae bacterium]|nr:hypothetical protein [Tenuifilaceae bacterium]
MEDAFAGLKKPYANTESIIPDHIVRAIENPREVPTSIGITMKERNKAVLSKFLSTGKIDMSSPIRFTSVEELNSIFTTGKLRDHNLLSKHVDAEGRVGVSAQMVRGANTNNPVMMAYGSNNKISAAIVFPKEFIEGRGMGPNEVKINPNMDVKKLKYVVGGYDELLSHEEMVKAMNLSDSVNISKEAARRVIPDSVTLNTANRISRSGSANIIASEATGGLQKGMTKSAGNSKVITELLMNTLKRGI